MSHEEKQSPLRYEIKGHRVRALLTQDDSANLMGVTRRTWTRWETGQTKMPYYGWEYFKIVAQSNKVNEVITSDNDRSRLTQLYDDMTSGEQPDT